MLQPIDGSPTRILQTMKKEDLDPLCKEVFKEVTEEVILGLCFEVHRAVKLGISFLDETPEDDKKYEIVNEAGLDIFGQMPLKKQFECVCLNCQRSLAASRFAPHLEKCMGMGRNSSRLANKRIANTGKIESECDDFESDSERKFNDRKTSKKRKDAAARKTAKTKTKNCDGFSGRNFNFDVNAALSNIETAPLHQKKTLLKQMCGVISEHTKKMCTRTHKCPKHTDEQRVAVRISLLENHETPQNVIVESLEDMYVDVDSFEDGKGVLAAVSLV